jgi:hypothetical protein
MFRRVGSSSNDQQIWDELEALAEETITDDVIEEIAESISNAPTPVANKLDFKREVSTNNFHQGGGAFRRG